jgi:hypothetical protein
MAKKRALVLLTVLVGACGRDTIAHDSPDAGSQIPRAMLFEWGSADFGLDSSWLYHYDCWGEKMGTAPGPGIKLYPGPEFYPGPCSLDVDHDGNGEYESFYEFSYDESQRVVAIRRDDGLVQPDGIIDALTDYEYLASGELDRSIQRVFDDATGETIATCTSIFRYVGESLEAEISCESMTPGAGTRDPWTVQYRHDLRGNLILQDEATYQYKKGYLVSASREFGPTLYEAKISYD